MGIMELIVIYTYPGIRLWNQYFRLRSDSSNTSAYFKYLDDKVEGPPPMKLWLMSVWPSEDYKSCMQSKVMSLWSHWIHGLWAGSQVIPRTPEKYERLKHENIFGLVAESCNSFVSLMIGSKHINWPPTASNKTRWRTMKSIFSWSGLFYTITCYTKTLLQSTVIFCRLAGFSVWLDDCEQVAPQV